MIYPEKYNSASRFLFLEHSQEINMTQDQKLKYLSVALRIFGIIFIVGIYAMMMWIWPRAGPGNRVILAARNPMEYLSLIWFTIWSSFVHGGIMLVQSIVDENERANLLGDIPALFLVAIVLWVLVPRKREA